MSNNIEKIKKDFNNFIKIYIGLKEVENSNIDPLIEIRNIIKEYKDSYVDFCKIIKEHLSKDDTPFKIRLFHILDTLFKSEEGDLYINQLKKCLNDNFKECFTMGNFDDRVLLFKIFYTWKYVIPSDLYTLISNENKIDDFKAIFVKKFPGKINKYDDYNKEYKQKNTNKLNINKTIPTKNFQEDNNLNKIKNDINEDNNPNLTLNDPKKVKTKKLIGKKTKSTHKKSDNENTNNKKMITDNNQININNINNNNPTNLMINPNLFFPINLNVSQNEINLFVFLTKNQSKLSKNLPFFSSIAKYYNEALIQEKYTNNFSQFKEINNNDEAFQEIKKRMKKKLFYETSKNNCSICGFKTLFYKDLVKHLDIHFNFNLLEMEGKNLFRKKAQNKNNWIYGNKNKNLKNKSMEIGIGDTSKDSGTLDNLIFYRNMMNNNLIKINNEQEEDDEEFMYPINDDNRKICHYCGEDFNIVFSTKYNYWFYNKVVVVIDDKNKYFAHQACFEELNKKIK